MRVVTLVFTLVVFFVGCNSQESTVKYNGKKLLEQKCAKCHNLDMPPTVSEDELAPPMMAVSFHVHSFVKPTDESQRTTKSIEFVVDYVRNPSVEKSFCDKESLQRYGLMPSQKSAISVDETRAVAKYIFEHFNQKNLKKMMDEKATYDALPEGEKIALRYNCLSCHKVNVATVGPSLISIAKKYKNNKSTVIQSIKNGSSRKWKKNSAVMMPAFKKLNDKELELLSEWILNTKEVK